MGEIQTKNIASKGDVKNVAKLSKFEKKAKNSGSSPWSKFLTMLQELGKTLQFPIAMLPFAAILNRFGQLGIQYTTDATGAITNEVGYWISFIIQQPGAVAFDNLALFFAIGVAFGLAKDHRGEVALVGALFYLILVAFTKEHGIQDLFYKNVLTFKNSAGEKFSNLFYVKTYGADGTTIESGAFVLSIGVLGGIVSGCFSAFLYNRLKEIQLPKALSFFGGRRFVPMVAMVTAIGVAFVFAIIWPWIQYVLIKLGNAVADPENPAISVPGTALYAFLNRLLLPFGLHQILNTLFWFQLPVKGDTIASITGNVIKKNVIVNGDINAFMQGISNSGLFQSGFFPIMMGGIPAIAVAMILTARKENRANVAGFLGGVAGVAVLSGITEPIEFSFVFLSPVLLLIHAGLSAIFMGITTAMHIQVGFGFSAGLIDYCISFVQSWGLSQHLDGVYKVTSNPLWILVLVVAAFATWFFTFFFAIKGLKVMTPGREIDTQESASSESNGTKKVAKKGSEKYAAMAKTIVDTIGAENFVSIDNCATRLRLVVTNNTLFEDAPIKASGAFGVKRLGTEGVQIVIGPDVEHVTNELKKLVNK